MIEQPFALGSAQRSLQQRTVIVAREAIAPWAAAFDRTEAYPWANVETLVSHRFFGMTVPESLGGQGRSVLDVVLVVEEMAKACGATGRIVVEANPGALGAIMAYGSVRRERRAAEFILQSDKPAICITEPAAGSAATEMRTIARRQGDRWILDGRKSRIAGGGISKLHLIFARVQTAGGSNEGIGAFIAIRGELSGLKVGRRIPEWV
jgi:alkylation response protein AidB-like acyl-CoA dehydrogenase